MVAVAPYFDAVGWLAVPGAYPVDGLGGCVVFVALGVARQLSDVYSMRMGTTRAFTAKQAPQKIQHAGNFYRHTGRKLNGLHVYQGTTFSDLHYMTDEQVSKQA